MAGRFLTILALCAAFATGASPAWAQPACTDQVADVPVQSMQDLRLALVARAQPGQAIRIMAYIVGDDDSGMALLRALTDAARRGVQVQLLVDGVGPGLVHPLSDELIAAIQHLAPSFEIRLYHPKYQLWHLRQRMHDKLFLVGDNAVLGSSASWDPSVRGWLVEKDVHVRGAALARMQAHFALFWNAPGSIAQAPLKTMGVAMPHEEGSAAGKLDAARVQYQLQRLQALPSTPQHMPERWLDVSRLAPQHTCDQVEYLHDMPGKGSEAGMLAQMLALMADAQQEILVVTPYVILMPEMRALLAAKVRAGVRVRLVTTSIVSLANELPPIAKAYADDLPLLGADGIEIAEYWHHAGRQMLHAKLVRVDGREYYIGSFNFDPLSAYSNTENGVVVRTGAGSQLARALDAEIDEYLSHAISITDGQGRLLVPDAQRCDEVNCGHPLRWLSPLIRPLL